MPALIHQLVARIRAFVRPSALDDEFDEELQAHLALAEADKIRQGMTREQARRAARVELGGVTQLREAGREARGLPWLDTFWLDIKLGLRMLRKSWGLTLIGGLAMTLAIMIAMAVYSMFAWSTGDVLPLDEGDRVVVIETWNEKSRTANETTAHDFERWRDDLRSVVEVGAYRTIERNLSMGAGGQTDGAMNTLDVVTIAEISAAGFRLARTAPIMGRPLAIDDEVAGAAPVVVIGHDAWQSHFAADPNIIGQIVRLGETVHTVVGVMPAGFTFPIHHRFWTALRNDPRTPLPPAPVGAVVGRLADGVTLERAQVELSTLGLLPPLALTEPGEQLRARISPYLVAMRGDQDEMVWVIRIALIVVTLLLVPPCANIAILVYARTITRQTEFAARYALGANRRRIVAQLFIEMLVLATAAAGLAILLTGTSLEWAVRMMISRDQDGLPFWVDLGLPPGAVVFALVLAVFASLIAGLLPALKATGRTMQAGLRGIGSRTGTQLGTTWTALVIAQVAMTLAALPAAVEIGWGTIRNGILGPGFAAEEYLTARVALEQTTPVLTTETRRDGTATRDDRLANLETALLQQLTAEAGVSGVTMSSMPGDEQWDTIEIDTESQAAPLAEDDLLPGRGLVRLSYTDDTFLTVFDIKLLAGNEIGQGDVAPSNAVVVNRTFAKRFFGEGNALGARLRHAPATDPEQADAMPPPWLEIVGVVEDRPAGASHGTVYHHRRAGDTTPASLMLRVTGDPVAMAGRLREVVASLDPALLISDVRTLDAVYREQQIANNVGAVSLGAILLSVLLLSAAGMYALMSFTVNQRRREIGIRSALGAQPRRLLAGIFRRAFQQLMIGASLGVVVALVIDHLLPAKELGGWPVPGIIPVAATIMLVVGLLAVAGPARRGLRVDPIDELRQG